jgi:polyhydroxybutyrate depolymerase
VNKRLVRLTLAILGLAIVLILFVAVVFRLVNRTNGKLISSGERRAYLLYVPESYDPARPTPLVISIHGFAEWPAHLMDISHWNDLADEYGFIVVYPAGTGFPLRWRTYGLPGSEYERTLDVTFFEDLIDRLAGEYNLDPDRIYANGLSNGGGMTFVLSCNLAERIAAIATVAGAFPFPRDACNPARPVPAMIFHGTADPIVPYQGGRSREIANPFPSIPEWVGILAQRNGCAETPLDLPASGAVRGIRYPNCNAEVIFYTIDGGGHTWPGGEPMPEFIVGTTTQDIDATRVIWDFFQQHPRPAP